MKKLIIITSDMFIRNYIQVGVFGLLDDKHTYYVASERVSHREELEKLDNFLGYLPNEKSFESKLHEHLANIQMVRHKSKSRTFGFRLSRYRRLRQWMYSILGLPLISSIALAIIQVFLQRKSDLEKYIKDISPDLIVIPSSVYSFWDREAIASAHKHGIKTLFLIDGWDNLSSKTTFLQRPDYLAVWGKQSLKHAVDIHGFSQDQVFLIGTPRFDHYFQCDRENLKSPYPFPYILFAGNAIPFDELSALTTLDHALDQSEFKDVKVVYRPHPWRQPRNCFDEFHEKNFKHVILDEPMKETYYMSAQDKQTKKFAKLPALHYYPALLNSACFVISPLSTMMVESAIFDTPVIALAYDDQCHLTSPHNALKYYIHFEGIDRIPGLKLCLEHDQLNVLLKHYLQKYCHGQKENMRPELDQYLCMAEKPYAQRLVDVVKQIEQLTS